MRSAIRQILLKRTGQALADIGQVLKDQAKCERHDDADPFNWATSHRSIRIHVEGLEARIAELEGEYETSDKVIAERLVAGDPFTWLSDEILNHNVRCADCGQPIKPESHPEFGPLVLSWVDASNGDACSEGGQHRPDGDWARRREVIGLDAAIEAADAVDAPQLAEALRQARREQEETVKTLPRDENGRFVPFGFAGGK